MDVHQRVRINCNLDDVSFSHNLIPPHSAWNWGFANLVFARVPAHFFKNTPTHTRAHARTRTHVHSRTRTHTLF